MLTSIYNCDDDYCLDFATPLMSATHPMSPRLVFRSIDSLTKKLPPYVCPSCRHGRSYRSFVSPARAILPINRAFHYSKARLASTVTPVSAVDVNKRIPAQYEDLYRALENLGEDAKGYISYGRLKFCMKYLRRDRANIRVAGMANFHRVAIC